MNLSFNSIENYYFHNIGAFKPSCLVRYCLYRIIFISVYYMYNMYFFVTLKQKQILFNPLTAELFN